MTLKGVAKVPKVPNCALQAQLERYLQLQRKHWVPIALKGYRNDQNSWFFSPGSCNVLNLECMLIQTTGCLPVKKKGSPFNLYLMAFKPKFLPFKAPLPQQKPHGIFTLEHETIWLCCFKYANIGSYSQNCNNPQLSCQPRCTKACDPVRASSESLFCALLAFTLKICLRNGKACRWPL